MAEDAIEEARTSPAPLPTDWEEAARRRSMRIRHDLYSAAAVRMTVAAEIYRLTGALPDFAKPEGAG